MLKVQARIKATSRLPQLLQLKHLAPYLTVISHSISHGQASIYYTSTLSGKCSPFEMVRPVGSFTSANTTSYSICNRTQLDSPTGCGEHHPALFSQYCFPGTVSWYCQLVPPREGDTGGHITHLPAIVYPGELAGLHECIKHYRKDEGCMTQSQEVS